MNRTPPNSIHPKTRAEWRRWLEQHHTQDEGVWLIGYKKGAGQPRMEYNEAVEEALCFGWIDSKPNKLDEQRSMLWFAPRSLRRCDLGAPSALGSMACKDEFTRI